MVVALGSGQFEVRSELGSHRHALPPILLGLTAPMLLFLLIDPRAITNASVIAHVYMIALFVVASAAYLISLFESGEVSGVIIDRASKTVTVERTGLLAKTQMEIPFADVATVRTETYYDCDGYKTLVPVLVLTTRELLHLPAGTTDGDVAAIRAILRPA